MRCDSKNPQSYTAIFKSDEFGDQSHIIGPATTQNTLTPLSYVN